MFIKLRNMSPVTSEVVSQYLLTEDFRHVWAEHKQTVGRKVIVAQTDHGQLITIPHSSFSASNDVPNAVTVSGTSRLGLFEVCLLSTEGNLQTALMWLIRPVVPVSRFTQYGVVAATQPPSDRSEIQILSQTDGILIVGDSHQVSSALMLEIQTFEQS